MAREDWKLIVIHAGTGKRFEPRDVRAELDGDRDRDQWRDHLVAIAQSDSYLTSGGVRGWIGDFEGRIYSEREHRKGTGPGEWGTPEKVLRFHD